MTKLAKVTTVWEVWTYDVWGNARDGYEVNDRRCQDRALELELEPKVYNEGQPGEFTAAHPTDKQIRGVFEAVFGLGRTRIETDGDDLTVYVTRERDGYPIGEMYCTSHESLSPIRVKAEAAEAGR